MTGFLKLKEPHRLPPPPHGQTSAQTRYITANTTAAQRLRALGLYSRHPLRYVEVRIAFGARVMGARKGGLMATAAVIVALDQQAVIDTFMRTEAVRPAQAILFEPKGAIQRSFFRSFTKAGIIKPEGARWYLDLPSYSAAKRSKRKKTMAVAAILAAAAGIAALL